MTATVPFKTQLGHDELRARTLKLGQRHRTILFLVDGKRPLSEVLSLALQAGAATHHFEELLRLGLVELPPETQPVPVEEAPPLAAVDEGKLTTVELVVPEDEAEQVTVRAPLELPVPVQEAAPPQEVDVPGLRENTTAPAESALAPQTPPQRVLPVLNQAVGSPGLDIDLPLPNRAEAQWLQQVRDLLTEALRLDAPLFSARTFVRVRNAQSAGELIDLVWEIQDHLSHKRRSRKELQSLQRARELLGLGNTLVDENSTRPPYLDE